MTINQNIADTVAYPLYQSEYDGSIPTSALQLNFYECDLETAKTIVKLWHSRLPNYTQNMASVCFVAEYENIRYATAIWSNPVSPSLSQYKWMELRRLAISDAAPKNTASRMISQMTRIIKDKFSDVDRLISYQDTAVHSGTIYAASNWTKSVLGRGDTWDRSSNGRPRIEGPSSKSPKQRWDYILKSKKR